MATILTKDQLNKIQPQELSTKEREKRDSIFRKMRAASEACQQPYTEFDGMTLERWIETNAELANAYIRPKKNKTDSTLVTGTPRSKLKTIASSLLRYNFVPEVIAYDKNSRKDTSLGYVMSKLLKKSDEIESGSQGGGVDEKRMLRYINLLEQGTSFIEESWVPDITSKKRIIEGKLDPASGFEGLKWITQRQINYKCESTIKDITQVYLGDIKQYEMDKQPYIFTRLILHYDTAAAIYGQWKNWKHVVPGNAYNNELLDASTSLKYRNFRLQPLEEDQVEIIEFQERKTRTFQLFINGVMMLPCDFPFPWQWDGYSITKQVLFPFSAQFAYGKSLMAEVRSDGELLDKMIRLLVSKTEQSIKPPTANLTGDILNPRLYDAGTMWNNLDGNKVMKLIDHQGVTQSEFAMYELLERLVSEKTVSKISQGQSQPGNATATEILTLQKQAEINTGLIELSVRLMEEKRYYLRLYNILENWIKPVDYVISPVDDKTKEAVFRRFNVDDAEITFSSKKMGKEERIKNELKLYDEVSRDKKLRNDKVNKYVLHLDVLQKFRYSFYINVTAGERESSSLNKILFREKMEQGLTYFGDSLNKEYFKEEWATLWQINPEEAFTNLGMEQLQNVVNMQEAKGQQDNEIMPGIKQPIQQQQKKEDKRDMKMEINKEMTK